MYLVPYTTMSPGIILKAHNVGAQVATNNLIVLYERRDDYDNAIKMLKYMFSKLPDKDTLTEILCLMLKNQKYIE